MTIDAQPAHPPSAQSAKIAERRVMAVITVIALHVVVYALGKQATYTLSALSLAVPWPSALLVSLLQAWCSLAAIWWAVSHWPSHVKTVIVSAACVAVWSGVVLVGTSTEFQSDKGAGWLASLTVQCLTVALGALLVELVRSHSVATRHGRFTIMFLLIWTAVVAAILGSGRMIAEQLGWTSAIFGWEHFLHLQVVGLFGALQAVSLWTVLNTQQRWRFRLLSCGLIVLATMISANVLLSSLFEDVGADAVSICWMFGGQAVFLLATLVPLHVAHKPEAQARGEEFARVIAGPQTPPQQDSGR